MRHRRLPVMGQVIYRFAQQKYSMTVGEKWQGISRDRLRLPADT
jgi:hypothetical protein